MPMHGGMHISRNTTFVLNHKQSLQGNWEGVQPLHTKKTRGLPFWMFLRWAVFFTWCWLKVGHIYDWLASLFWEMDIFQMHLNAFFLDQFLDITHSSWWCWIKKYNNRQEIFRIHTSIKRKRCSFSFENVWLKIKVFEFLIKIWWDTYESKGS